MTKPARWKKDCSGDTVARARHLVADVTSAPTLLLPAGKRLSFGWQAAPIAPAPEAPLVLRWPDNMVGEGATSLRIALALDVRGACRIGAALARSGRAIGACDVHFASVFQPCEIALEPGDGAAAVSEGVALRVTEGAQPFWAWMGGAGCPAELRAHLLLPGTEDALKEFHSRMESLASIQPFGWMEGCILDGLLDLATSSGRAAARDTAEQHLALYIREGRLVYENPRSEPQDGGIYGVEGLLPLAALARLQPGHALLDVVEDFCLRHADAEGAVIDGSTTTSEGSYTLAYPLARVARLRKSEELERLALTQLRQRQRRLFDGRSFHRTRDKRGQGTNRNWARGIAWQLLGLARTLEVLRDRADIADLIADFRSLAAWTLPWQRSDGLWCVFVDEPRLAPDTSGSAGIAAALAIGVHHGWLQASVRASAAKTLAGLRVHLTPDGFLGGAAQSNKGGEALQRSDYRVIFQMGMGLMAQLIAALEAPEVRSGEYFR